MHRWIELKKNYSLATSEVQKSIRKSEIANDNGARFLKGGLPKERNKGLLFTVH